MAPALARRASADALAPAFHLDWIRPCFWRSMGAVDPWPCFQPNNRRRAKVHGFRARMRTRAGRAIVTARRGKGRSKLTA